MMENCHVDVSLSLSAPLFSSLSLSLMLFLFSLSLPPSLPFSFSLSLFCISSRWKLHLLQSSFCLKARGQCICGMREKKALDALSITGIIIPTVTLMIRPARPAPPARAQPLCSRPSLSPSLWLLSSPLATPCVREYENPYNETILADGKKGY